MPIFTYTGSGNSLSVAGRTLVRGVPTILEGRAAASAAAHPDVVEARTKADPRPKAEPKAKADPEQKAEGQPKADADAGKDAG